MEKDKLSAAISEIKICLLELFMAAYAEAGAEADEKQLADLIYEAGNKINDLNRIAAEMELIKNGREQS